MKLSAVVLALTVVFTTVLIVYGDTVYEYYGIKYNIINNTSVSICGRSDDSTFVVVPEQINNRYVTEIADRAFALDEGLTGINLEFATELQRIGSYSFKSCTGLSGTLTLTSSVTEIGTAAFENCTSLNVVDIQSLVTVIPAQCFNSCSSLRTATLSNSVTSIENYAFANCSNLVYIVLSSNVNFISGTAFQNDDNLTLGVYYDTYSHHYAEDYGISYIVLDPENIPTEPPTEPPTEAPTDPPTEAPVGYLLGDTDDNDDVEVVDATWLQRYIALMNIGVIEDTVMQGDVDGDGDPSIVDAAFIMRYCVGIETPFDIGELVV